MSPFRQILSRNIAVASSSTRITSRLCFARHMSLIHDPLDAASTNALGRNDFANIDISKFNESNEIAALEAGSVEALIDSQKERIQSLTKQVIELRKRLFALEARTESGYAKIVSDPALEAEEPVPVYSGRQPASLKPIPRPEGACPLWPVGMREAMGLEDNPALYQGIRRTLRWAYDHVKLDNSTAFARQDLDKIVKICEIVRSTYPYMNRFVEPKDWPTVELVKEIHARKTHKARAAAGKLVERPDKKRGRKPKSPSPVESEE